MSTYDDLFRPKYNYSPGRAIDIPPKNDVFNWIRANYNIPKKQKPTCDSGGYYTHIDYGPSYIEKCSKPAVYRYMHTGVGQEKWRDGYRCEQHAIEARDDLLKITIG